MSMDFETAPPIQTLDESRREALRGELLEGVAFGSRHQPRASGTLIRRHRGHALALVGVAAVFFAAGAFAFTSTSSGSSDVTSPGFSPSAGWTSVSTGATAMDTGPTAIASNGP